MDGEWCYKWYSIDGYIYRSIASFASIALYYISLLSGLGNIDDQNRNPNINNRDHLVGRPTSHGGDSA